MPDLSENRSIPHKTSLQEPCGLGEAYIYSQNMWIRNITKYHYQVHFLQTTTFQTGSIMKYLSKLPNFFVKYVPEQDEYNVAEKVLTLTTFILLIVYFVINLNQKLNTFTTTTQFLPIPAGTNITVRLGCTSDRCLYNTQAAVITGTSFVVKKGDTKVVSLPPTTTLYSMTSQDTTPNITGVGQGSCTGRFDTQSVYLLPFAEGSSPTDTIRSIQDSGVIINDDDSLSYLNNQNLFLSKTIVVRPGSNKTFQQFSPSSSSLGTTTFTNLITSDIDNCTSFTYMGISPTTLGLCWSAYPLLGFRSFLDCPTHWDGETLNRSGNNYAVVDSVYVGTLYYDQLTLRWSSATFNQYTQQVTHDYTTVENAVFGAASASGGLFGVVVLILNLFVLGPYKWLKSKTKVTSRILTEVKPASKSIQEGGRQKEIAHTHRMSLKVAELQ